jgi:hypothetical protein
MARKLDLRLLKTHGVRVAVIAAGAPPNWWGEDRCQRHGMP